MPATNECRGPSTPRNDSLRESFCYAQDDNLELIYDVSTDAAPISGVASAPVRRRYQNTIASSENIKMMVEIALISGVMPRRNRPQISSGSVLSRPIRKKLTAISSMDRVKMRRAAPMIESLRLGTVMRQKVCQ